MLSGPDYPAPAKLNLFLHVIGRRPDGYHLLQTAFRFIGCGDCLRFRVRADGVIARVNPLAAVPESDDLCVRAARALQEAGGTSLGADIELDKRLPLGGGLGGAVRTRRRPSWRSITYGRPASRAPICRG